MIVIPAIDLLDGKCVRLLRGEYDTFERVAEDAVEAAKRFIDEGATHLHVVDLNGAKEGRHVNFDVIEKLCRLNLTVDTGGGIRTEESLQRCFDSGVQYAVLGSAAVSDTAFLEKALQKYGERIVVGVDAKNGEVRTSGWLKGSGLNYIDFSRTLSQKGVRRIIFTDISKDGTLEGVSRDSLQALISALPECEIVASGGVRDIQDIAICKALGAYGVICGKSLYKGTLSLKEAIALC